MSPISTFSEILTLRWEGDGEVGGLSLDSFALGPVSVVGGQPNVQINRGTHCGWLLGVSGDSNTSIREALM